MVNPDMATGSIEVVAETVTVLNGCRPLPFQVSEAEKATEENRLKYRYIHLRHPLMANNLRIRHLVSLAARRFLSGQDFLEV